jgi:pimeloyl-ACP methyl ester carboxylesterase
VDPTILDTHLFAGASLDEINEWAAFSRPGVRILRTPTAQVRVRVVEPPKATPIATVIMLPDAPNTIEHYDELLAAAAARRMRAVAVEIPGFGFSWATDPAALPLNGCVEATAAALRQLDDALGGAPVVLTGVCVQAYVALALATWHGLGDAVVLAQAPAWQEMRHWATEVLDPRGQLRTPWIGQAGWRLAREAVGVRDWYRAAAGESFDVQPWQNLAHEVLAHHPTYALASLAQTWLPIDPAPDFGTVGVPAALIWGAADRTHAKAGSDPRGMLRHLPHGRLVEFPDAGHFPDLEQSERFLDVVADLCFS